MVGLHVITLCCCLVGWLRFAFVLWLCLDDGFGFVYLLLLWVLFVLIEVGWVVLGWWFLFVVFCGLLCLGCCV